MFPPSERPRLFAVPPGADFPAVLLDGLRARCECDDPLGLARVEVIVNTSRMARRLSELCAAQGVVVLPRITLLTDLPRAHPLPDMPPIRPALSRHFELTRLIEALLAQEPELAPQSAVDDLAVSLAGLIDELHDEGVGPEAIRSLDVGAFAAHWALSRRFLDIALPFALRGAGPEDAAARLRTTVERLADRWHRQPPGHAIVLAGSTGSRGSTALLMQTVARLPQGAVVLPGFDSDLPGVIWDHLDAAESSADHPQDRLRGVVRACGMAPGDVPPWVPDSAPDPARNRLVSLALRPAPVTDQWLSEGAALGDPAVAVRGLSLIEAPSPRSEALAIATALRRAVQAGKRAALITPDRILTRQVSAALDRWAILADDSAGTPLALSAPGRLLRQVLRAAERGLDAEALIALLKHPLTARGSAARGAHLRLTREFELHLRRNGPAFPTAKDLRRWADRQADPDTASWAGWVAEALGALAAMTGGTLAEIAARHVQTAETFAAGPGGVPAPLWEEAAGREAARLFEDLRTSEGGAVQMTLDRYDRLLGTLFAAREVRDALKPDARVMIWGSIEARVQGADLVIIGGLNEGIWPSTLTPDPWLNRPMRRDAGLPLPERRVGLQAHDFQQAICAPEVILSRARRDSEAETVPSRWLNRLLNLLEGLGPEGKSAVAAMEARGKALMDIADALDRPLAREAATPRPAPRPPVASRPTRVSITEVETLRRDPYAIYARHVLGLRALDPLRQMPDARDRGTALHAILERFVAEPWEPETALARFTAVTDAVLAQLAGWPAATRLWRGRFLAAAPGFLAGEAERRATGHPIGLERSGAMTLADRFEIHGRADRIDRTADGRLAIYDYKTGGVPTEKEVQRFNRQLHLAAAIAEAGGFQEIARAEVAEVAFLGITSGKALRITAAEHPDFVPDTLAAVTRLLARFHAAETGFVARAAVARRDYGGDYDHLARFGEWSEADPPVPEALR